MIVSKSSLLSVLVTAKDKDIPALDNIRLEADGTVIGAAGNVVLAVSPVHEKVAAQVPLDDSGPGEATIAADTVRKALKLLQADKTFGGLLEHCDIAVHDDEAVFTFTDGKRKHTMNGRLYRHAYIPWEKILETAMHSKEPTRVVLNRARLRLLLDTIEKICPDSTGQNPVYIEFTSLGDIICRARNAVTGQRVLATMKNYSFGKSAWLSEDEWERRLAGGGARARRDRTKVRGIARRERRANASRIPRGEAERRGHTIARREPSTQ
jgi:hypothetical protein